MAPPDIKMNPDGIRQAAGQLREGAEAAKSTIGSLFHSGNEAGDAHAGWNSGAALKECGHTWWKELTTLVEQTAWTAWKLEQSANAATAKDVEAHDRLTAVLDGLEKS